MDEELANTIILSVKSKHREFSNTEQLYKEIEKIREAGMEFFAKLYCKKYFDSTDFYAIPDNFVPSFIDYIEPYVAVGLAIERSKK
ncbi:hypothetical protein [Roseibium sp.]|uniref:hypothetical protein n=1 Tax=Roseibium sp. TaxID=1936156 RepID=UPI003B52614F